MLERTKTHHTADPVVLSFAIPPALVLEVRDLMRKKGIEAMPHPVQEPVQEKDTYTLEELFDGTHAELAASALRGARYREELTQAQLAEKTGISRRHISEYENARRPMGKQIAKRLAAVMRVDYRVFL